MPAECPRSSVEYRTAGRSGFQMRSVRSTEPVAINWPAGFHASVRILFSSEGCQCPDPARLVIPVQHSRMRSGSFRRRVIVTLRLDVAKDEGEVLFGEEVLTRSGRHHWQLLLLWRLRL